jgi:hypothetical protein
MTRPIIVAPSNESNLRAETLFAVTVPVTRKGRESKLLECSYGELERADAQLRRLLKKQTAAANRRMSPTRLMRGKASIWKLCLVETLLKRMPKNKVPKHLDMEYLQKICDATSELYRARMANQPDPE